MPKIKRSQIAGMNIHYKYFPLSYFLDSIAKLGMESVELWGASPHFDAEDQTFSMVRGVKKEIQSRGLKLVCFTPEQCLYPVNIAAKEKYIRDRSMKYFIRSMEAAAELEAPKMLVTSGWGYLNEPIDEPWNYARESLCVLADEAKRLGLMLALEPLRTDESNLVNSLKTLQKMLSEVNSSHLKGMIDTIPMALNQEEIKDYFEALGSDMIHIHFIDGKPRGHLAWGDGVLPLERYLEQINHYQYDGNLTLEITDGSYYMDPVQADKKSLEKLFAFAD